MTTLTPETQVGEIAAQLPSSVRVFERYGIDFCCGGKAELQDACQAKGIDPAAILEQIRESGVPNGSQTPDADWQSAPLGDLIDYILTTHHVFTKTQLPKLEARLEKMLSKHPEKYGHVLVPLAGIFRPLKEELEGHLMKEEMILFPLIRSMESGDGRAFHCGSVGNPIRVMVMEHDSAGDALARIRELTSGYAPPEDACNTFRAFYYELEELERDLHRHVHLENNILFPRALEL